MNRCSLSMAVVLILGVTAVCAQGPGAPPPGAPPPQAPPPMNGPMFKAVFPAPCPVSALRMINPHMIRIMTDRVSLKPDQEKKVMDILEKSDQALEPIVESHRKASTEMVVALTDSKATESDLLALARKAMDAETQILSEKIKALIEVRAVLDDAQKTEFDKVFEQQTLPWRPRPMAPPAAPAPPPPGSAIPQPGN